MCWPRSLVSQGPGMEKVISKELSEQCSHSLMNKIYFLRSLLPGLNKNAFKELAQCWILGKIFHIWELLLYYAYYVIQVQININAGKDSLHLKKSPENQHHVEAF